MQISPNIKGLQSWFRKLRLQRRETRGRPILVKRCLTMITILCHHLSWKDCLMRETALKKKQTANIVEMGPFPKVAKITISGYFAKRLIKSKNGQKWSIWSRISDGQIP